MTKEIESLNLPAYDTEIITQKLKDGFKLLHFISYVDWSSEYKTRFHPNGSSYSEEVKELCSMIKYILERDNISKQVFG